MIKCPKCNYENEDEAIFCSNCGESLTKPKDRGTPVSKFKNKKIIGIIIAIAIIIVIGALAMNHGDFEATKFSLSSSIKIDNVVEKSNQQLEVNEYGDYDGHIKTFIVTYTPETNLKNVTIECYAYDKNGDPLDPMANVFGYNPLNVIVFQQDLTKDKTQTGEVVFGLKNATDFDVSYFEVFVYKTNEDGTGELIDKFRYDMK